MKCFICNNEAIIKDKYRKGFQKPDIFQIYYCDSCKTTFSFPQVSEIDFYDKIYNDSSLHSGYARYKIYAENIKKQSSPLEYLSAQEEVYWAVNKSISEIVDCKKDSKILEIGCGMGYLTFALHKAGFNILGLDISQKAIDYAIKMYGDFYICADIFEYSKKNSNKFDIVILTEVIEHVTNPIEFLKEIKKLLTDKGKIIVSTPENPLSKYVWNTDIPPIHQWWFSKESMKFIGDKLQLSSKFVDFSEFYKENYLKISTSTKHSFDYNNRHFIDEKGELISRVSQKQKIPIIKSHLSKISLLKNYYHLSLRILNWIYYLYNKKGRIICVIYEN